MAALDLNRDHRGCWFAFPLLNIFSGLNALVDGRSTSWLALAFGWDDLNAEKQYGAAQMQAPSEEMTSEALAASTLSNILPVKICFVINIFVTSFKSQT